MSFFAFALVVLAAPDAGVPTWKQVDGEPVVSMLFSRKPVPDKNNFGVVSPVFASPVAFSKSKHAVLEAWSPEQRAMLNTLVELSKQPKPELAIGHGVSENEPLPHARLAELKLTFDARAKVAVNRYQSATCCDDSHSDGLVKDYPVRVRRDAEGRVVAALFRWESFISQDNHGGRVTEKNANSHTNDWALFVFDEAGRVTGFVRFLRDDNVMRYGPELQVRACNTQWADDVLINVVCHVSQSDDEFQLVSRVRTWTKP